MADFFRVRIASKRQVTLPQLMLNDLHLVEGDELEFEISGGLIRAVRPLKLVPADYIDLATLEKINARAAEMDKGIVEKSHGAAKAASAGPSQIQAAMGEEAKGEAATHR